MMQVLAFFARQGRLVLAAGLVVGVVFPPLALSIKPWLPELVSSLLFLAALRIGLRDAAGNLSDTPRTLASLALYQLALPLLLIAVLQLFDLDTPLTTGLVLMASAASISGSPNICVLTGNDPSAALRLLVVGTAILPLTVIPIFSFMPQLGSADVVFEAVLRLLAIIIGTTFAGFALRHIFLREPKAEQLAAIDGVSSLTMAVMVVGLMSALGPALSSEPLRALATLCAAFVVNYSLQVGTFFTLRNRNWQRDRVAFSVVAGNRNMALFLAVLPLSVTDPILLFVACYQVPMFLSPMVLGRLYQVKSSD